MKLMIGGCLVGLLLLVDAAVAMPRGAFSASQYEEAKAKAVESAKPIAIVTTNLKSDCPKCLDGNDQVFKQMRRDYILVINDSDSGEKLPEEVLRTTYPIYKSKGNIIPIVSVLSHHDGQLLGGLCYKQISAGGKKAFSTLETEVAESLAKGDIKKETPAPKADDPAAPVKLREWRNSEGRSIMAEAIRRTETSVTFRMEDGRTVDYPLDKLSEDSRKEVAEILSAN